MSLNTCYLGSKQNTSEKACIYDPLKRTKCRMDKQDFQTCLLCQLSWTRGLLFRLAMDVEDIIRKSPIDIVEAILRRNLTDREREIAQRMYSEGKTIREIVEEIKKQKP